MGGLKTTVYSNKMNKTEKLWVNITVLQRDMTYKFLENHHLMKKFIKWWNKQELQDFKKGGRKSD